MNSKHLTGAAFDVDFLGYGRDEVPGYVWTWMGELGRYLGLRWGGDWRSFYDPGHFEL
jgi:hypothetical protein